MRQVPPLSEEPAPSIYCKLTASEQLSPQALNVLFQVHVIGIEAVSFALPTRSEQSVAANCLSAMILGKRLLHSLSSTSAEPS